MAARSKAWVCRSCDGIAGSNSAGGMDVCPRYVLCVIRKRSLPRADHSSRGILPTVARPTSVMVKSRKGETMTRNKGPGAKGTKNYRTVSN